MVPRPAGRLARRTTNDGLRSWLSNSLDALSFTHFGVVESDLTWNIVGLLGYKFQLFGAEARALGGYRVLYQDFEDGNGANKFACDVITHGPIIGLKGSEYTF